MQDEKDLRIAEMERQLEEAKANALIEEEQLLAVLPEDFGAVEYIKSLESQLRESQLAVVALREALKEAGTIHGPLYEISQETMGKACHCMHCAMIRAHLSNTSATAQQTVKRIEREALEKAVERLIGRYTPSCSSFFFDRKEIRAAILGDMEKNQ